MARLLDYGMRAGGIAERKGEGVAGQKSEQTVYVWEGNEWSQVYIHTLDLSHQKKSENIKEEVKKKVKTDKRRRCDDDIWRRVEQPKKHQEM